MRLKLALLSALALGVTAAISGCSSNDNEVGDMTKAPVNNGACAQKGQAAPAADGCNTCTCGEDGSWSCTQIDCNTACTAGQSKPAGDGCNTCTCAEDRTWACTSIACDSPTGCQYGGMTYQVGATFPDDDGCNTCSCMETGQVACTTKACAVCPAPGQYDGACITVIAWARDPASGMCCEYGTPCAAPDGWQTFGSEQECSGGNSEDTCPTVEPDPNVVCAAVVVWSKSPETGSCCMYGSPCTAPEGWMQYYSAQECEAGGN